MTDLFERVRRRKAFRWAAAYLAAAWVALQVVQTLGASFPWLDAIQRPLAILLGFGFLGALVVAWYHGEKGRQRVTATEVALLGAIALTAVATLVLERGRAGDGEPRHAEVPGPGAAAVQLAVLPFEELGDDADRYAAGLHREIIRFVSGIEGVEVRPAQSVTGLVGPELSLRTVGTDLAVDYLLSGSMQVDGDRLRLIQQLVEAASERVLWSGTFDADLTSSALFALQDSIARLVADALAIEFSVSPSGARPDDVAYRLYLQSFAAPTEDQQVVTGIPLLREAIALDSTFVPAFSRLAYLFAADLGFVSGRTESGDSARYYGERAIALDPSEPYAWFALGQVRLHNGRVTEAIDAYEQAQRLPDAPPAAWSQRGFALTYLGRYAEAMDAFLWTVRAEPGRVIMTPRSIGAALIDIGEVEEAERWVEFVETHTGTGRATALWFTGLQHRLAAGRYEDAQAHADLWVESQPTSLSAQMFAFRVALRTGDLDRALPPGRQAHRMSPGFRGTGGLTHRSTFGQALILSGMEEEGRAMLRAVAQEGEERVRSGDGRPGVPVDVAIAYAGLGDVDRAIYWLEEAYEAGWRSLGFATLGLSGFSALEGDPRFRDWIARIERDNERQRAEVDRSGLDRAYALMVRAREARAGGGG